jgi:hypothetical protein
VAISFRFGITNLPLLTGGIGPMQQRLGSLLHDMQPGAMLFFSLFEREDSSAKVRELGKLLLDCL